MSAEGAVRGSAPPGGVVKCCLQHRLGSNNFSSGFYNFSSWFMFICLEPFELWFKHYWLSLTHEVLVKQDFRSRDLLALGVQGPWPHRWSQRLGKQQLMALSALP